MHSCLSFLFPMSSCTPVALSLSFVLGSLVLPRLCLQVHVRKLRCSEPKYTCLLFAQTQGVGKVH